MKLLRYLTLIAAFLFAALSVSATSITVASTTIPDWTFGGTKATLRIYPNRTFVTSAFQTIHGGTASGFYKIINCTVVSSTVSCPSLVLDSTTDSSVPIVVYIADLYDSGGRVRTRFFDSFRVPITMGTSVTWNQLRMYNEGLGSPGSTFYTADQTDALLAAKQATLVSGTNIKTINSGTILGSGNLPLQVPLVSGTNIKTVNGTSLLGAGNLLINAGGTAGGLDFAGNPSNVNHGQFWTVDTVYGDAYWSAWVKGIYPNETGYYISDGSGGQHDVLNGVSSDASNYGPTGNIWNGTATVSYVGTDSIPLGDWAHIEWVNSGNTMYALVDGVCTFYGALTSGGIWTSTYTGTRHFSAGGSDGNLYVGGSFHNNFPGIVKDVRGVEGSTAGITVVNTAIPQAYNGYIGTTRASFSTGYEAGGTRSFVDMGAGFESRAHHGAFSRYNNEIPWPTWVAGEPSPSTVVPTPPATPSLPGPPLVFDSFSRVNSLYLFDEIPTLGATETGSLGTKTWHTPYFDGSNTGAGVLYGKGVIYSSQISAAWVVTDRTDVILKVTRPDHAWASTGVIARYNSTNGHKLIVNGFDDHVEFEFAQVSGSTFPIQITVPTEWTELLVVVKGTSLRVYTDGVYRGAKTIDVAEGAAVNHGLASAGPVTRFDDFGIYALPADTTPPSIPTGLTATAISDTEIQLSAFQTSTDSGYGLVAGYEYRRDGGSPVDMAMTAPWIVSGLIGSTSYNFEVRAYDDSGNRSGWSTVVTRSTLVPPTPLIDAVGSSAAFAGGLRKLRTAYGGAIIRVRRVSDNVEQDFSPVSTSLDWAAITTFKGASSLTVVKLYDQSGNGYDEVQATTTKQPSLDTVNREIDFDGTDDYLSAASVNLSATNKVTVFAVVKNDSTFATQTYFEHSATVDSNNGLQMRGVSFNAYLRSGTGAALNNYISANAQSVYQLNAGTIDRTDVNPLNQVRTYINTVIGGGQSETSDQTSTNFGSATLYIGARAGTSQFLTGSIKEISIFPIAMNGTLRGTSETNINAAYLIY